MPKIKTFVVGMLKTNCYVVESEISDVAVIVDPGGGYKKITDYLCAEKKRPVAALCTHGHFDHVMDGHLWQKCGIPVYINQKDYPFVTGERTIFEGVNLGIKTFNVEKFVEEGDELRFDDLIFRVIETPGHSQGSVCYVLNGEIMFCGDTIFFHSVGRTDLYGGDFAELAASVKRILTNDQDLLLYPGHGESTTIREEKLFNPFL